MKVLVDTQMLLWHLSGDESFPAEALELMETGAHEFSVHVVSFWEIQIKHDLGKLPLPISPKQLYKVTEQEAGFRIESMVAESIFNLTKLPRVHHDPFDRLLIAHALLTGMRILTADARFREYPVGLVLD